MIFNSNSFNHTMFHSNLFYKFETSSFCLRFHSWTAAPIPVKYWYGDKLIIEEEHKLHFNAITGIHAGGATGKNWYYYVSTCFFCVIQI